MPNKFISCVNKVKKEIKKNKYKGNAYAICRVSTSY